MTGILGPGRLVGMMLSRAGRRLERAVDRFAEERLGLGPNQAALRLTSALHDIHVHESPECHSDHVYELNTLEHVTDRLIWACNGYCSGCYAPYLLQVLDELPEDVLKAIQQLIKHLQYVVPTIQVMRNDLNSSRATQPMANIGFACVYIRLLVQSNVLGASSYVDLGLLDTLRNTRDVLWPSYSSQNFFPDELAALKSAIIEIQRINEDRSVGKLVRFPVYGINKWEDEVETLSAYISCLRWVSSPCLSYSTL
jgi:hypothetical protein